MIITRTSILSGITRSLDLPVTNEQMVRYLEKGELVQMVFANLTIDEREFIINGNTADEWDSLRLED